MADIINERTYYDVVRLEKRLIEDTYFDVSRVIPMTTPDYSNLDISISAGTLSDSFKMSVPLGNAGLRDVIKGKFQWQEAGVLKEWPYDFSVSDISVRNGIADYTGIYNNDKLNYTYYDYTYETVQETLPDRIGFSARRIVSDICDQLGLTLVYNAMDWAFPLPKVKEADAYEGHKRGWYSINGTYASVISQLFGWLSMLPNVNFSVTIRNGVLYVTQRGYEANSENPYEISTVEFPPVISRHLVHTEWSGSGTNPKESEYTPDTNVQVPYSDTIQFGDCSITYENGYLISETRGTAVTTYTYTDINNAKYLSMKETVDTDTCSKTVYTYAEIGTEIYLQREDVYTDGDPTAQNPYDDATHTAQTHTPLGNSWYGTTVYDEDNEVVSTSLSQGMPGNSVTQYMIDSTQEAFTGNESRQKSYRSPVCISTNYPVMESDDDTLDFLIEQTDWLNNRTEETVSLTTVDKHIIDTTQLVRLNGNDYHVESNEITHSPQGLRQSLTLKRWY